jgi:hypothetical protein
VDPVIESLAYREAGHVVVAYLITKAGIADHFFALPIQPADRPLLVPAFDLISLNGELSQLARPSPSLRSLITMPLFLLGGVAAVRIREGTHKEVPLSDSRAVSRAMGMMASYLEEYGGADSSGTGSMIASAIKDFYLFVECELVHHWPALQALAQCLLEKGSLSRADAFELLDTCIPESDRKPSSTIAG